MFHRYECRPMNNYLDKIVKDAKLQTFNKDSLNFYVQEFLSHFNNIPGYLLEFDKKDPKKILFSEWKVSDRSPLIFKNSSQDENKVSLIFRPVRIPECGRYQYMDGETEFAFLQDDCFYIKASDKDKNPYHQTIYMPIEIANAVLLK